MWRCDLVDLRDVLVGQLLELLLRAHEVIFRDAALALKLLELFLRVPADVPNGNPALLGPVVDQLHSSLRRSSVSGGKLSRITVPSLHGVIPRSLDMMAFSIAPIASCRTA